MNSPYPPPAQPARQPSTHGGTAVFQGPGDRPRCFALDSCPVTALTASSNAASNVVVVGSSKRLPLRM